MASRKCLLGSFGCSPPAITVAARCRAVPRAVVTVAASMLAVNPRRRPTMASVLLQLQGIGETPEPALPSVSSRILQMRAYRPDVMVAVYAVLHTAEGQAVRWHLRAGDTFLVKGEWDMWMKESCARVPSLHRTERCPTRMPSPQQRRDRVPSTPRQRAHRCATSLPGLGFWPCVAHPREGHCRGVIEGQHVVHVVTRPGSEGARMQCSPLRPLLHGAELSHGAASIQPSVRSRRTPLTAPLYIDDSLGMPVPHKKWPLGCLRASREVSVAAAWGVPLQQQQQQQQRPLR